MSKKEKEIKDVETAKLAADAEQNETETSEKKDYIKEFELSNGTKCVMERGKGITILRARKAAQDEELIYAHIVAATTRFNGKKLTAEDIASFDVDDYILLEYKAKEFVAPKNLLQQGTF